MKLPCQEDPDLWLSDFAVERAQAAKVCRTGGPDGAGCPRLAACLADGLEGGNTWGVWGGVDLSRTKLKPRTPAANVCQNPECKAPLMYDGTRRRYCKDACQQRGQYLKKRAAA